MEYIKNSYKLKKKPENQKKTGQRPDQALHKRGCLEGRKHLKKYSLSYHQGNADLMRHHHKPTRIVKNSNTSMGKDIEQQELSVGGSENWSTLETSLALSVKAG